MAKKRMKSISMIREDLDNIPQYTLPPSYTIRWYQPGDDKTWLRIEREAEKYIAVSDDLFEREFGKNLELLSERQCFLCDPQGNEIGTATAWFNNNYNGKVYGVVHWVAIVPQEQGKGLSKPLMTVICNRLRELGYERACLNTGTLRIPAIRLYLRFGFVPEIRSEKDALAWRQVEEELSIGGFR